MKNKLQNGQSLIELLLVIGLSAILLPALITGLVASREGKAQQGQRAQAITILNQTIEGVRSVRERGWSLFTNNGTFYPTVNSGDSFWSLAPGEYTDLVTGFKTKVEISNVNRDSSGVIAAVGTLDPSSKKVVVTISWGLPYISEVSDTLYMTRYLDNDSYVQTTEADFNAGTKTGTTVTNTAGGEVTLGAGGQGDWCKPSDSIVAQLDLPKQGVADTITAIEGRAFVGTGENASGVSFANIAISNTNPPVPSIIGTFDGYKTNGVFGEIDYAYIATDDNSKEVVIIDLNQKDANDKYLEAGYFDAPGNNDGYQLWVSNNVGYVLTNNARLYSFDLSNMADCADVDGCSIKDPDGVTLAGNGRRIVIVGTYAYVTITESITKMQIIDVNDPNNLIVLGQTNLTGKNARDIFVNTTGTRAYFVTSIQDGLPGLPEFFVIDVSTKTGERPVIGTYDVNGMNPRALTVVPGNKAIIVGKEIDEGSEEYQVINIIDDENPTHCGGLDLGDQDDRKVNGISSVLEADGDAYSYIMTGNRNAEFKIIEGGPGGQYASSGEFVSSTFDPGYQTAFNRFDVSVDRPANSDIKFQAAVEEDISGSCAGVVFTFVGPDATSATFFTTTLTSGVTTFSYAVPASINPGRCFRYEAFFSTLDFTSTPVFYDVTVNYSP